MSEKIAISVIMPIYNVEKYLEESLESVLNQSFKNIEIICVDDGSTDASGAILDDYAKKDSRICVIHKSNSGYGNSMNVGLKNARGKYIAILEPDDFISETMYSDLYKIAEMESADFVKSNFAFLSGKKANYTIRPTRIYDDEKLYNKVLSDSEKKILFKGYVAHWTSIYRKEFLNKHNILFNETPGASYQDTGFWFQTLYFADKVYLCDNYYYHYRQDNPNSSINNREKVYCICAEYDFILSCIQKDEHRFTEYLPSYINCRYAACRDTINRIADKYKEEFIIHMRDDFSSLEERNLLDTSCMNESDFRNLQEIISEPAGYYQSITKISQKLQQLVSDYEEIYIYGAGYLGKKVLKALFETDRKRVSGFLVSKIDNELTKVEGVSVYEFNESLLLSENVGIIVGVTQRYEKEIVELLNLHGIKNVILVPRELA